MRVLFVSYGYGGDDVSEPLTSFKLSKELEKYCNVKILTKDNACSPNIVNIKTTPLLKNSSYYRAVKPDYPEFIIKAYRYAKKHINEFDIIHHVSPISMRYPNPLCNLDKPFIWGSVGGSIPYPKGFKEIKNREPLIQKLRSLDLFRLNYDPLMINTLKNSKKIIVSCKSALNNLPAKYQSKTTIIPEGINTDSSISNNYYSENEYIFSSGRLVPYKGFELLIRAFSQSFLAKDAQLLITGDGKEKEFLYRLIHDLDMNGQVKLLGKVPKEENLDLMGHSLFCVFPALNEAFGHVNLEAMSMKKPVIVTDNGGPADIVVDDVTGFKIQADSVNAYIGKLTEKLNMLYYNKELRNQMALNAHERIKKIYSWDSIGKQYIELYEKILKAPYGL